jgi:hypothetical protein
MLNPVSSTRVMRAVVAQAISILRDALHSLAGVTGVEVQRLVELGILVARDGPDPFLDTDVRKVRLAAGCEQAGLPMEAIAAAIGSPVRCGCSRPAGRER